MSKTVKRQPATVLAAASKHRHDKVLCLGRAVFLPTLFSNFQGFSIRRQVVRCVGIYEGIASSQKFPLEKRSGSSLPVCNPVINRWIGHDNLEVHGSVNAAASHPMLGFATYVPRYPKAGRQVGRYFRHLGRT